MKKTSQGSLLFRQNVNRTEEERIHFLDGYRKADACAEWRMRGSRRTNAAVRGGCIGGGAQQVVTRAPLAALDTGGE